MLPLLFWIIIFLQYAYFVIRDSGKNKKRRNQMLGVGIYIWVLMLYPTTIYESMMPWACTKQSDSRVTLDSDPSILCNKKEEPYASMHNLAMLCFCGYGLPSIFLGLIWYHCYSGNLKWTDRYYCEAYRYNNGHPCYNCDNCDKRQIISWMFAKYHFQYSF